MGAVIEICCPVQDTLVRPSRRVGPLRHAALACLLATAVATAGAFLYSSYRSWRDSPILRTEYKVEPRQDIPLPDSSTSRQRRPGSSGLFGADSI